MQFYYSLTSAEARIFHLGDDVPSCVTFQQDYKCFWKEGYGAACCTAMQTDMQMRHF